MPFYYAEAEEAEDGTINPPMFPDKPLPARSQTVFVDKTLIPWRFILWSPAKAEDLPEGWERRTRWTVRADYPDEPAVKRMV